jgi:hypothetical protein
VKFRLEAVKGEVAPPTLQMVKKEALLYPLQAAQPLTFQSAQRTT